MGFIRGFDCKPLPTTENPLFKLLYDSIKEGNETNGIVFPALRVNRLDFYCGGGVLLEYNGSSFKRNPAYSEEIKNKLDSEGQTSKRPISEEAYHERHAKDFMSNYSNFINENRYHFGKRGQPQERQYLERLYPYTYKGDSFPEVCVLDIEIRFNVDGSQKKCDMLLFNSEKSEIMFVEGKIYADDRMTCGVDDRPPKVIDQITEYTNIIKKYSHTIEEQYTRYISIMSQLIFGIACEKKLKLIPAVKLLVYETPKAEDITNKPQYRNRRNLIKKVEQAGIGSLWIETRKSHEYSLVDIWEKLRNG